jgi:addiction module RelB/DinJ family antitoxin
MPVLHDEHVLATIGLTMSGAFRLMMMRIAADKTLPFEPLTPNAETIEALKAARRGELTTVGQWPARSIGRAFTRLMLDLNDPLLDQRAH